MEIQSSAMKNKQQEFDEFHLVIHFLKYVSTNQSNIHQNLNEFELITKHAFEPQYIPERGLAELTGVIECFGRTAARRTGTAPFEIKRI